MNLIDNQHVRDDESVYTIANAINRLATSIDRFSRIVKDKNLSDFIAREFQFPEANIEVEKTQKKPALSFEGSPESWSWEEKETAKNELLNRPINFDWTRVPHLKAWVIFVYNNYCDEWIMAKLSGGKIPNRYERIGKESGLQRAVNKTTAFNGARELCDRYKLLTREQYKNREKIAYD